MTIDGRATWAQLHSALAGDPVAEFDGAAGWSRLRRPTAAPTTRPVTATPFAELHCHSNFSFLDGASPPDELVAEAVRLGLSALVLTDHDGMYGAVRLASTARAQGLPVGFGAELSVGSGAARTGAADPDGEHLVAIARGLDGYRALCKVISEAHLRGGRKGMPVYDLEEVVDELTGRVLVLAGACRKDPVRRALDRGGPEQAYQALAVLVDQYGRDHVAVALTVQAMPDDSDRNDLLAAMAAELALPVVASTGAHYAHPSRARLAAAMAAVRARRPLEEMAGWLPPAGAACLRSGEEMAALFARYPGAVAAAARLGGEVAFDLSLVAPKLPPFPIPPEHAGLDEIRYLRHLTAQGTAARYGPREHAPKAYGQLDHELAVIEQLGFAGYFLVVWDIVQFCRRNGILCQGRGSAANSAVCFAIGVTQVDAVRWGLLFERFLSTARDGPPDIDLDIEAGRREEVIQYVYTRHGRRHAAQVANVITYRGRSAVRDMARALGYSPGQQDTYAKAIDHWGTTKSAAAAARAEIPPLLLELADEITDFPRHLGIHSGGMVICDRPVSEVCPVEWARMPGRTVLQWDKEDCAAAGLVKFDLLGLGMLSAIRYTTDLIREHHGVDVDLGGLDLDDQRVYDMLCEADTVGVFQVESRAQMATLPRLRPRKFYDLVVEVALIRPGPIQGGSVHPYIRRRRGKERWSHAHPLLARALDKTLGVPLFQEQLMQLAVDVAGFSPAEADALRQAMGAKRSSERMERLHARFIAGAHANGLSPELAETVFAQIKAFSGYGFPESHSHSFAHLVFVSAWLKLYYPAAFSAGLLRAQPMGFYSPQSLVADARRHGVTVRGPDINLSLADASLETDSTSAGGHAVRLGLGAVRHLGDDDAERVVAERAIGGPFGDQADLVRRTGLNTPQVEALATAGAFGSLGLDRRSALWGAGVAARDRPTMLPGTTVTGSAPPSLPGMTAIELLAADTWATGVSPDSHPAQMLRRRLDELGALSAAALRDVEPGTRILIGGVVTHRQRPPTAGGITFLNIEDETGMVNVICSQGLFERYRVLARTATALLVRGVLESADGALNLIADHLAPLHIGAPEKSRDYR